MKTGAIAQSVAPVAEAQRSTDGWITAGRFAALLALLVFAMFHDVLLGTRTFVFRDFGLFSYPIAFFHKESFWRGELPFWNPYNYCGIPFLAQWNTMALYPLSIIYLLFPLPWSLPFFCLAHLFWGGLGMYFLACDWTGNRVAGALAGVIFSFNGLMLNFLMWPSLVATFAWMPWVLWLVPQAWQAGGRKLIWGVLAGSMQMLAGGPETILFTWLILLCLFACRQWWPGCFWRKGFVASEINSHQFWTSLLRLISVAVLVSLVCSAQLLPFLQLLRESQRDTAFDSASQNWAMPVWGWANFLVPLFRTIPTTQGVHMQTLQDWTSSYYAGIGTILLSAIALRGVRDRRVGLMSMVIALSLILAWGDSTLLYSGVRTIFPFLGFIRYSVKFVVPVLALAPLLAAFGLAGVMRYSKRPRAFDWIVVTALLGIIACIVLCERTSADSVWSFIWRNGLSRAGILVLVFALIRLLDTPKPGRTRVVSFILLLAFWWDFATHMPQQNPGVSPSIYSTTQRIPSLASAGTTTRMMLSLEHLQRLARDQVADGERNFLRNRGVARANANILDSVHQVDGFFPLVPRATYEVHRLLESNTSGAISNLADFMSVSRELRGDSDTLWIARTSAMPLVTAGQQPQYCDASSTLNALASGTNNFRHLVFLPSESESVMTATRQTNAYVGEPRFSSRHISFKTESSAACLVVISQSFYPCWQAFIDGRSAKIHKANHGFQALEVPSGKHEIELRYTDKPFAIGVLLSLSGLLVCLAHWHMTPETGKSP